MILSPSPYLITELYKGVVEQKIENLLIEKFKEEEFADCFVVEVKLLINNKLEVFVDSDSGMMLSKCQKISRYLEAFIDEEKWLGEKYTIEVSSPGIGRPLTMARQFKINIGRKLAVNFIEDGKKKEEGLLVDANDTACFLQQEIVRKEKNKKIKTTEIMEIPYTGIAKAKIKAAF